MSDTNDEFEVLFAELTSDEQTVQVESKSEQPETEATLVSKPEQVKDELPDMEGKPKPKYKEIPDDQKHPIDGSPFDALVYPAGYVRCKWPSRYGNQVTLYLDQFEQLREWMKSDECDAWLEQATKAGLRNRGA